MKWLTRIWELLDDETFRSKVSVVVDVVAVIIDFASLVISLCPPKRPVVRATGRCSTAPTCKATVLEEYFFDCSFQLQPNLSPFYHLCTRHGMSRLTTY